MSCTSTDTSSQWHNLVTETSQWKGTTSVWGNQNTWMNVGFDDSGWSTPGTSQNPYGPHNVGGSTGLCLGSYGTRHWYLRRTVSVDSISASFSQFQQDLATYGPDANSNNILSSSASSDLTLEMGNTNEQVTFTLTYPVTRWENKNAMTTHNTYTALSPTPTEGTYTLSDSDLEPLEVEAIAGDSLYLKIKDFPLSDDDECILEAEDAVEDALSILGFVGPYENSDDENVCGVLITLGSALLADRDSADVELELGYGPL